MLSFKSNKQFVITLLLAIILTLGLSMSLQSILADDSFVNPACPPPGCNIDTPINVGTSTQEKHGKFTVGTSTDANSILKAVMGAQVVSDFFVVAGPGASDGLYVRNSTGNIGIGTVNPGAKLDIDMTNLTATEGLRISRDAAASHFAYVNVLNESNNSIFMVKEDGNVGIGTNNPAYKLDVNGRLNASELCLNGDCKTAWSQVGGGALQCSKKTTNCSYGPTSGCTTSLITADSGYKITGANCYANATYVPNVWDITSTDTTYNCHCEDSAHASGGTCTAEIWQCQGDGGGSGGGGPDFETIQAVSAGQSYTIPHGLGVMPKLVQVYYCRSTDPSCTNRMFVADRNRWSPGGDWGVQTAVDSTNIRLKVGSSGAYLSPEAVDGGTGSEASGYYKIIVWKSAGGSGGSGGGVVMDTGVLNDGQTIPLPAGVTDQNQCKWTVSFNRGIGSLISAYPTFYEASVNASRVIHSTVQVPGQAVQPGSANYIIICNTGGGGPKYTSPVTPVGDDAAVTFNHNLGYIPICISTNSQYQTINTIQSISSTQIVIQTGSPTVNVSSNVQVFCWDSAGGGGGGNFGGSYEFWCGGNVGCGCTPGGTRIDNPLTGGQSCPSGFTAYCAMKTFDSANTNILMMCYK